MVACPRPLIHEVVVSQELDLALVLLPALLLAVGARVADSGAGDTADGCAAPLVSGGVFVLLFF